VCAVLARAPNAGARQSDPVWVRSSVDIGGCTGSLDGSVATNIGVGDAGRAAVAALCIISELIAAAAAESGRRLPATHSPHQSSSRTWGQTPSIMYAFADSG
jgi:hypothetical protein